MTIQITKKTVLVGLLAIGTVAVTTPLVAQRATTSTQSDEQQAINAVRRVKASVVNIVGKQQSQDAIFGTGFIVTTDGYIVSNSHVVENKNATYRVELFTGQTFDAQIIGIDKYYDIAVIKINAKGLGTVNLGNSDNLETGQSVFAIGNSLGKYQHSVTRGVVSGLGRNISLGTISDPQPRLQNLIQTDASINPGNSGGPLISMSGEVVGMNTLVDTSGQGVGFAIPSNVIKDSFNQLKSLGKVPRPYVGITFETIDDNVKFVRKLSVDNGAFIVNVDSSGPAAKAGIKAGDIVTNINGEALTEKNEFDILLQKKYQAGNQVQFKVIRAGQSLDLNVILGEYK